MINNCVFVGRFVKDPEIKSTQSGVKYALFTLAIERNYAPEGGERETDFIDFRAWRGTAEFIGKWFHKGSWLGVEGELQTSSYEAEDGSKRKSVYCLVKQASFVGSKSGDSPEAKPTSTDVKPEDFEEANEEVPF